MEYQKLVQSLMENIRILKDSRLPTGQCEAPNYNGKLPTQSIYIYYGSIINIYLIYLLSISLIKIKVSLESSVNYTDV